MANEDNRDFARAITILQQTISFFPADDIVNGIIFAELKALVGTEDVREKLEWFAREAIRRFKTWGPDGCNLPNLRALYCTRYDPADGIQPSVVLEGYADGDLEARYRQREIEENEKEQAKWEEDKRLNPAAYAPLQLAEPLTKPFPKREDPPAARPPRQQPMRNGTLDDEEQRLKDALQSAETTSHDEQKRKAAELERQVRLRMERRGA